MKEQPFTGRLDLQAFRNSIESELRKDILPFWIKHTPDVEHGGFHGRISNDLVVTPGADKGIILNSRILWTFSRAFRTYREGPLLQMAERAYEYITEYFFDRDFGGVFWTVDHTGKPRDTKKRLYGQAFTIYALSEYHLATGDEAALRAARELFDLIYSKGRDRVYGGYFETYEREWRLAADQRLSEVDQSVVSSYSVRSKRCERERRQR
ncbi:MAG TPA: AGE family epimerase/isomerase [Blastocatellia bacterium]|nr:AGE family epimerase/isomerase [Blastocatellia bacterium]